MALLADDAAKTLDPRERMEYTYNARALLEAGTMHGDGYLQMLPRFLRDTEPLVVDAALDGLDRVRDPLITPDVEAPFAHYVRDASRRRSRFRARPAHGQAETVSLVRPRLLRRSPTRAGPGDARVRRLAHPRAADGSDRGRSRADPPGAPHRGPVGRTELREQLRTLRGGDLPPMRRAGSTARALRDPKLIQ
jgi:hypothetical protein